MPLRAIHNPGMPLRLRLAGIELDAFSVSGLASYVLVPEFDACFDLGHCALEAAHLRHVFLSHTHQDHAGGAPRHVALRRMFGARPSRIYCPAASAEPLANVLRAFDAMEEKHDEADPATLVTGLSPGDVVKLRGRFSVEVFEVDHRITSVGFTVVEHRRVLKPAWVGASGPEIAAAREEGVTVHDLVDHRRFTYVGDSTPETLWRNPTLGDSDVLFLEATHLPGTPRTASERWGHTHFESLVEWLEARGASMPCQHIILKHFSMKYRREEVRAAWAALPEHLQGRITMLMQGAEGRAEAADT